MTNYRVTSSDLYWGLYVEFQIADPISSSLKSCQFETQKKTLGRNPNGEAEAAVAQTEGGWIRGPAGHQSRSSLNVLLQEWQQWEGRGCAGGRSDTPCALVPLTVGLLECCPASAYSPGCWHNPHAHSSFEHVCMSQRRPFSVWFSTLATCTSESPSSFQDIQIISTPGSRFLIYEKNYFKNVVKPGFKNSVCSK